MIGWLVILAAALVMWLLMIRPAQRRQAETMKLQKSIAVGDEVMLTSGIFGTIVEETDDHLGVEVADGLALRVVRGAIASKVHRDEAPDEASETADDAVDDVAVADEADDSTYTTDEAGPTARVDGED